MDSELITGVVSLLTAALTLWQEYRHRKLAKAEKVKAIGLREAGASGPFKTTPVKRRK